MPQKESHEDGTLNLLGTFDNLAFPIPDAEWASLCVVKTGRGHSGFSARSSPASLSITQRNHLRFLPVDKGLRIGAVKSYN